MPLSPHLIPYSASTQLPLQGSRRDRHRGCGAVCLDLHMRRPMPAHLFQHRESSEQIRVMAATRWRQLIQARCSLVPTVLLPSLCKVNLHFHFCRLRVRMCSFYCAFFSSAHPPLDGNVPSLHAAVPGLFGALSQHRSTLQHYLDGAISCLAVHSMTLGQALLSFGANSANGLGHF